MTEWCTNGTLACNLPEQEGLTGNSQDKDRGQLGACCPTGKWPQGSDQVCHFLLIFLHWSGFFWVLAQLAFPTAKYRRPRLGSLYSISPAQSRGPSSSTSTSSKPPMAFFLSFAPSVLSRSRSPSHLRSCYYDRYSVASFHIFPSAWPLETRTPELHTASEHHRVHLGCIQLHNDRLWFILHFLLCIALAFVMAADISRNGLQCLYNHLPERYRPCHCIGTATVDVSPCAVVSNGFSLPYHHVASSTLRPFCTSLQSAFVGTVLTSAASLQILFSVCSPFQIVSG